MAHIVMIERTHIGSIFAAEMMIKYCSMPQEELEKTLRTCYPPDLQDRESDEQGGVNAGFGNNQYLVNMS